MSLACHRKSCGHRPSRRAEETSLKHKYSERDELVAAVPTQSSRRVQEDQDDLALTDDLSPEEKLRKFWLTRAMKATRGE